jgi:hypothetical protein
MHIPQGNYGCASLLRVLVLLASCVSGVSQAAVTPGPDIEVDAYSFLGYPTLQTRALPANEIAFGASIEFPGSGFIPDGDLYVGLMRPDGTVYTWTNANGKPLLAKGMQPVVRGMDLGAKYAFNLAEVFGQDPRYVFSGDEPHGMYTLFAVIVAGGGAPANKLSWYAVDMAPLFVE